MLDLNMDVYVPAEDGTFVSETHARIAEIIQDYDRTLSLAWIPPSRRESGEPAFAVVHRPLGLPEYVVCYSDTCDDRLLARVFSMDNAKGDVLSALEANNAAIEALRMKKQMEEMEEAREMTASIIKSPLHRFKHNGVVYE